MRIQEQSTRTSGIGKFNRTADVLKIAQRVHKRTRPVILTNEHSDIEFLCVKCNYAIATSRKHCGQPVRCSECNEYVMVPSKTIASNIIIDDFVIQEEIGSGGTGTVYRAHQTSLDRLCAIKILHDSNSDSSPLFKEARLAAKLIHNNIIQCYAVSKYNNFCYYAMEYIEGSNLQKIIKQDEKLDYRRALNIIIQISEALNYAWQHSHLVHHDINPDNIIIDSDNIAKLSDLGLARLNNEVAPQEDSELFFGTPEFTSPENVMGGKVSFQGDIYSLGAVFYLMVTGHLPHTDDNRIELMKKHITDTPVNPKIYTPELPDAFIHVIGQMMAKQPEKRYQDYDALLDDLIQLQIEYNHEELSKTDSLTSKLARLHLNRSNIRKSQITAAEQDYIAATDIKSKLNARFIITNTALILIGIVIIFLALFYYFKPVETISLAQAKEPQSKITEFSLASKAP